MGRVALVNMPWVSLQRPSIALGILKEVLKADGIGADVFYLNLRMAARMDLDTYTTISDTTLAGEWFFSRHLFGDALLRTNINDTTSPDAPRRKSETDLGSQLIQLGRNMESVHRLIPEFIQDCLDNIPWSTYDIVGFTSVFAQQVASLLLAKRIKELHPAIKVVFGGANVQQEMGVAALRAFDWVDYVVDGEAEQTFPLLVKNVVNGNPFGRLPGISLRHGDAVTVHQGLPPMYNLNDAPIPDYSDYFNELEAAGLTGAVRPQLLFESSRGCWWGEKAHCTFCGLNGQLMKYRAKGPKQIKDELAAQSYRYKTLSFESVDNILDMNSFSDLLPQLAGAQSDLELFYEIKSSLTRDQVDKLAAAGVTHVQPGIESLSTDVLKLMRKGVTGIQNVQLLKWCLERGIDARWNILFGFPGERAEHYAEMFRNIPSLFHLRPPSAVVKIILQRFSPYHFDAEKLGIRNIKPSKIYRHLYPDATVDLDQIAYYFDYTLDHSQADPDVYIAPVRKAVDQWNRSHFEAGGSLRYYKAPGFIEVQDSRANWAEDPLGRRQKTRTTILTGVDSEIFQYCDSIRGLKDIFKHGAEGGAQPFTEDQARESLDRMTSAGVIYVEKERYLALAIRGGHA